MGDTILDTIKDRTQVTTVTGTVPLPSGAATSANQKTTLVSTVNSSAATLTSGATFTGDWEDATGYPSVACSVKTDQAGSLYIDFSTDGSNSDSTLTFAVAASTNELHRLTITKRYYRVRFTNSSVSSQTYLRLQSILGSHQLLTSPLNIDVTTDADANTVKAVLHGQTDSGNYVRVPATSEGHLEVAIHSPLLPFGSIHAESLTPIFQSDAIYGINTVSVLATTNASGSATASDSAFVCATGVTIYGAGALQSRKRLRYRAGQGSVGRFTSLFTAPVVNSYQLAGLGHAEDGIYFGYAPATTDFGILRVVRGKREVRTLTITTKSSTAENAVVRLDGTNFNVPVTNGASTITTAYEISQGTYTGWTAEAIGSTVVFVASSAGAKVPGTFTLTASTAVGTFATTSAGVAATETFVKQSEWNGDKMDGTGNSGVTADWTKLNVFQIHIQGLGAGALVFMVEAAFDGNNPVFITVHTIKLPNTLTATSFGNPSFPFTMTAYSYGSTTDLTVKTGSFAGFIEGPKVTTGPRMSYIGSSTGVGAANFQCLFSVRNSRYFGGRTNQSVVNLLSVTGACKHNSPVVIYVFRGATLAGSPNFTQHCTPSCTYVDTAATTCTIASNDQLIWSGMLGDTGNFEFTFSDDVTLQPGEVVTVAAKSSTGTPTYVYASLNTREDQ